MPPRVGNVACILDVQSKGIVHDAFHVCFLEKIMNFRPYRVFSFFLKDKEGKLILEPKTILELKVKNVHSRQNQRVRDQMEGPLGWRF